MLISLEEYICGWIHQKHKMWCIPHYMMTVMFSDLLASSNFPRIWGTCRSVIALGRFAQMFRLWHSFLYLAKLWICGYASLWRRRWSGYHRAGTAAPRWEPGACSVWLPRSCTSSPVWGHGEAWPTPLIQLDKSDDDDLRWSEKLHRRQRCSDNGNISNVIRSQPTEKWSTEKALLKANSFIFPQAAVQIRGRACSS